MGFTLTFAAYQKGLEQGKILGLRCASCHGVLFPPTAVCRACGGSDLTPVELSGRATLRTFTVIRVAPEGKTPPYVVAMAELDEGPWAMGNLVDMDPDTVDMGLIGRRVTLGSRTVKGDLYAGMDTRVLTFSPRDDLG